MPFRSLGAGTHPFMEAKTVRHKRCEPTERGIKILRRWCFEAEDLHPPQNPDIRLAPLKKLFRILIDSFLHPSRSAQSAAALCCLDMRAIQQIGQSVRRRRRDSADQHRLHRALQPSRPGHLSLDAAEYHQRR